MWTVRICEMEVTLASLIVGSYNPLLIEPQKVWNSHQGNIFVQFDINNIAPTRNIHVSLVLKSIANATFELGI